MSIQEVNQEATLEAFASLSATVARLRDPETGCPWDLTQTHETLRRYLIEEAYEAVAAMESPADMENLCEELGDVLFQVVLHAQLAQEAGEFSMQDILEQVNTKMIRRHPHVFGDVKFEGFEELGAQWEAIKALEQGKDKGESASVIPYKKIQKIHPASHQAAAIGKAIEKADVPFDFGPDSVLMESEIGDLYFSLAQRCRKLGLDPELTAQKGNEKVLSLLKAREVDVGCSV